MTPAEARSLVRAARQRLALNDPARAPLLDALVRDDADELRALAAANPEPQPPAPAGPGMDPLLAALEAINPAEAAWLVAARARLAAAQRERIAAQAAQGQLSAEAARAAGARPDAAPLSTTVDRPALAAPSKPQQRGLWEAA